MFYAQFLKLTSIHCKTHLFFPCCHNQSRASKKEFVRVSRIGALAYAGSMGTHTLLSTPRPISRQTTCCHCASQKQSGSSE